MADESIKISPATEGTLIDYALDKDADNVHHQLVKMEFGDDGVATKVSSNNPLPTVAAGTESILNNLKSAVDALSAKIADCNTGAVALDAGTLAALESVTATISGAITVANPGITDAQLRASPIPVSGTFYQETQPVSAAALPLPTGAATETTLSGINNKLPTLDSGRIPVALPAGGGGLTDNELRASPIDVTLSEIESAALRSLLKLSYTLTGQRVDCGGSSVTATLAASQTLTNLTTLVGIGYNTQNGQAIQQSQLAYNCGFGRNIA